MKWDEAVSLFWPRCLRPVVCRLNSACAFARSKTCLCPRLRWTGDASLLIRRMWFGQTSKVSSSLSTTQKQLIEQWVSKLVRSFIWAVVGDGKHGWYFLRLGHTEYDRAVMRIAYKVTGLSYATPLNCFKAKDCTYESLIHLFPTCHTPPCIQYEWAENHFAHPFSHTCTYTHRHPPCVLLMH